MRSWPTALLPMFPTHPLQVPTRPWWSRIEWGICTQLKRVDGAVIASGTTADAWEAVASAYDARRPMPHPGVRVGQTWALVSPAPGWPLASVFTITEFDPKHEHFPNDGSGPGYFPAFFVGSSWMPQTELEGLVAPDCFLVADTACPWLAPWAPL